MASTKPLNYSGPLKGKRILVVEDEAVFGLLLESELTIAGAKVVGTACTVAEALQLIDETADNGGISAAVLDLNLAGEPVWLVADALEELGIPFLFETGYGPDCNRGGYVAAPILHKPFDPQRLVGALKVLVSPGR